LAAPERKVAREEHVGPIERDEQESVRRPWPDPGHLSQRRLDLVVTHPGQHLIAKAPVDETLGDCA
jgi:hypothetical protein